MFVSIYKGRRRGRAILYLTKSTLGREEIVEEEEEDDAWLEDSSDLISELTEGISGRDVGAWRAHKALSEDSDCWRVSILRWS